MSSDQTDPVETTNPFGPQEDSTSARNLFTVTLQILGLCLICRVVLRLPQVVTYVMYAFQPSTPLGSSPLLAGVMMVVQLGSPLVVGIGVILLARRISRWFYPVTEQTWEPIAFGHVSAGNLYQIASFMMGVYVSIQAVGPAVRFLQWTMGTDPLVMDPWAQGGLTDLITASVYSVLGLVLMFGSRGISQAMVPVPRDSDEVPAPQFSIRALLILGVAFAIVLGVMRLVVVGVQ